MIGLKASFLKNLALPIMGTMALCVATSAHDPITTKITWDREIVRIVNVRCTSCHQKGGKAFSLTTYEDARPWAQDILEETLQRQMPPWGAVKGFGQFSNDEALTQDELDLIANWVDGGAPEGDSKDLPADLKPAHLSQPSQPANALVASGDFKLPQAFTLGALWPKTVPDNASMQITAQLPDGSIQPLVWLDGYKKDFSHPFVLETPLVLPAGTSIEGIPAGASISLITASSTPKADAHSEGSTAN